VSRLDAFVLGLVLGGLLAILGAVAATVAAR